MSDRSDICRRHGLAPEIADQLVGETAEELEADGAARAAVAQMLGGPQVEPPVEGLAPGDKPVSEYTEAERAAQLESLERTVRERAESDEQNRLEAQAEANRTDDQLLGDAIRASAAPGAKDAAQRDFLRSIHGDEPR